MREKPLIVKRYGDKFKVTICNYNVFATGEKKNKKKKKRGLTSENKLENNISRAKNMVYEYAKCNEWQYFITLTLNRRKQDRYDLQGYIKDLGQFIRDERKRTGHNIKYLLVPEKHKDGAWHMHGYVNGIGDDEVRINHKGYLEWSRYARRFGYCSLDKIKYKDRCDTYIAKYISKDLGGQDIGKNKKLYYASRGLSRAEVLYESYTNRKLHGANVDWENEFVQIKWLNTFAEVESLISTLI